MLLDPSDYRLAQYLLERTWQQDERRALPRERIAWQVRHVGQVLPDLLRVVDHAPHVPVQDRQDMIREVLRQQFFVHESSGCDSDPTAVDDLEHQVQVVSQVLEEVRQRALKQGELSAAPVPPLMCG